MLALRTVKNHDHYHINTTHSAILHCKSERPSDNIPMERHEVIKGRIALLCHLNFQLIDYQGVGTNCKKVTTRLLSMAYVSK